MATTTLHPIEARLLLLLSGAVDSAICIFTVDLGLTAATEVVFVTSALGQRQNLLV
jgi:hypothetical protein